MKATPAGVLPGSATPFGQLITRATVLAVASVSLPACDGPWELDHHGPALRNASDVEETVSVQTYQGAFPCDALHLGPTAISRAGLDEPRIVTLSNGETVELDSIRQPDAGAGPWESCGTAVVSSARLRSPLLITWDLRAGVDASRSMQGVYGGQVYLEQFGAELRASPGPGMVVTQWNDQDALP